jgi:hypothetical protein
MYSAPAVVESYRIVIDALQNVRYRTAIRTWQLIPIGKDDAHSQKSARAPVEALTNDTLSMYLIPTTIEVGSLYLIM